ncbi:MAG: metallophosphoesterase family protein [bacterium]
MNHITWLHLSDLHFHSDEIHRGAVEGYNQNVVLDNLLDDLCTYPSEHDLVIDFIIITGDIAFSGQADEYMLAVCFLDKLREIFSLPKNRLFIVPGNHDVDRGKINPHFNFSLNGRDDINSFLLNSEAKQVYFKKFNGYRYFINKYFGCGLEFDYVNRYFWARKFSLKGTEIGLLGLNSAWNSSGDTDKNHLLIGEKQVRDALKQVGQTDLCIATFHHPLEWLRDDDKEDVRRELSGKAQFILHGHLHKPGIIFEATPDASFIVIPAGATYENRLYTNSYNYLSINRVTSQKICGKKKKQVLVKPIFL